MSFLRKIRSFNRWICEIDYLQLLYGNVIRVEKDARLQIEKNVTIRHSRIVVRNGHQLFISSGSKITYSSMVYDSRNKKSMVGKHCTIKNAGMYIHGELSLGDYNIIELSDSNKIYISDGSLTMGHHNMIHCKIWIRFNGKIIIGAYNNINENTWLRADENISIGDYNQISYNVMIWDSNTHSILPPQERRLITEKYYPLFGYEEKKPITKPVVIGNDCWLAQNVAILKGTYIEGEAIVGFGTIISNKQIPYNSIVVGKSNLYIKSNTQ